MFYKNETIYRYNGGFKRFFAELFPDVYATKTWTKTWMNISKADAIASIAE